jgi:hypothetical protein
MARDGDDRLASVTLFTTMTDFTDVGEINVFMDASEVTLLEDMMWQKGYLGHKQVSGGFPAAQVCRPDLVEDGARVLPRTSRTDVRPHGLECRRNAHALPPALRSPAPALRGQSNSSRANTWSSGRAISISNIHVPDVRRRRRRPTTWRSVALGLQAAPAE